MWALFSNSQPQNIGSRSTFKASFLMQQISKLEILQSESRSLQQSSAYSLRACNSHLVQQQPNQNQAPKQNEKLVQNVKELSDKTRAFSNAINQFNLSYQISVQSREIEKVNDHLFFKAVLQQYDDKRKALKSSIIKLESKVQDREYVTMSQRSYRAITAPVTKGQPNSEVSSKFNQKFDQRNATVQRITGKMQQTEILFKKVLKVVGAKEKDCSHFTDDDDLKIEADLSGLISLLKAIGIKEKIKKKMLSEKLMNVKTHQSSLNLENRSIREASIKCEETLTLLHQQKLIQMGKPSMNKIDYIDFLKSVGRILKKRFADGISYQRGKYRSKSITAKKYSSFDEQENSMRNSSHDISQKQSDLNGDLTASFMQHCEYLISEKFIVDVDEEQV